MQAARIIRLMRGVLRLDFTGATVEAPESAIDVVAR